jgi:hypothetical protein
MPPRPRFGPHRGPTLRRDAASLGEPTQECQVRQLAVDRHSAIGERSAALDRRIGEIPLRGITAGDGSGDPHPRRPPEQRFGQPCLPIPASPESSVRCGPSLANCHSCCNLVSFCRLSTSGTVALCSACPAGACAGAGSTWSASPRAVAVELLSPVTAVGATKVAGEAGPGASDESRPVSISSCRRRVRRSGSASSSRRNASTSTVYCRSACCRWPLSA